jgi:hypothetical protein
MNGHDALRHIEIVHRKRSCSKGEHMGNALRLSADPVRMKMRSMRIVNIDLALRAAYIAPQEKALGV